MRGESLVSTDAAIPLTVERLTFGPDALARQDGQVVFVPYAAPGDRIVADVVERRRDYLRARVRSVDTPGAARVLPGCAHFSVCGGCQWQHVAPAAQREAKAAVVAEQLARVAGVADARVLPTLPSPADWGYRDRITLVVEGRRLGYHRARSHTLVEIAACPIAAPALSAHLDAARALATDVRVPLERLSLVAAPGGVVLVATATRAPGPADVAVVERVLARWASVRGAVIRGGGVRLVTGDPCVIVPLEPGLTLEVPADVFTQGNLEANRHLVATVLAWGIFPPSASVLDLYCGAGNFALPIARRAAHVLGIEHDALAVDAARANATRLGLAHATFRATTVAGALADVRPGSIDTIVLDPPRSGAADAMPALARLRAPRILYVSCDPATLARDVRVVLAAGYELVRVQPIDLFPQTYHVESVTELRLT